MSPRKRLTHRRRPDPDQPEHQGSRRAPGPPCPRCGRELLRSHADICCPRCGGCVECCPHLDPDSPEFVDRGPCPMSDGPPRWWRESDPDAMDDDDDPYFWNRRDW